MRTFVLAFDLSLETVERIVLVQEDLQEAFEQDGIEAAWIDPARIRVPLKVLRDVPDPMLERVYETVENVASALVPFKVSASGVRAHPSPSAPRLVYAAIDTGLELVTGLQKVLNIHLERIGLPEDPRPYRGWALAGRVRTPGEAVDVEEHIAPFADADFGHTYVKHIVLFKAEIDRHGPRYTVARRFRLGGPREKGGRG